MTVRNVAILVFENVEVLDFAGPFEVFSVTAYLHEPTPFHVYTLAFESAPVTARHGLKIVPDYTVAAAPPPDILVVPGGRGVRPLLTTPAAIDWLAATAPQTELLTSVCTGSLLLAKAGLLAGLHATTHQSALEDLAALDPSLVVHPELRFTDNGQVLTSGGISAGIDMALHIVRRLLGDDAMRATMAHMEYGNWR